MGNFHTLKKRIPLILAVLLSVSIILLALNYERIFGKQLTSKEGNVIEAGDWIATLRVIPTEHASEETLSAQRGLIGEGLSTTDRTAREMFLEYTLAQSQATESGLSTTSAEAIAGHLIEKAFAERVTPYTKDDILLAADTQTALTVYLKQLGDIVTKFYKTNPLNEHETIASVLETNDAVKLAPLNDRITAYKTLEKNLLLLKVPPTDADLHLRFVRAYANIRLSLESITFLFTDRVRGMVGITQYRQDILDLAAVANEFNKIPVPKVK